MCQEQTTKTTDCLAPRTGTQNRNLPYSQCPNEQAGSSQAQDQETPHCMSCAGSQTPCKGLDVPQRPSGEITALLLQPQDGGRSPGSSQQHDFPFTSKQPLPRSVAAGHWEEAICQQGPEGQGRVSGAACAHRDAHAHRDSSGADWPPGPGGS